MLAKRALALPEGDGWIFEPKWDGFRVIVFREGDQVTLQSRDGKLLNRYFPELVHAVRAGLPTSIVLDGEIVIARGGALDFEALQARVHPAASRVQRLAAETPASLVFWDLLAVGAEDWRQRPFVERRAGLEKSMRGKEPPLHLSPSTRERVVAEDWFTRFEGAGLDGVMAKSGTGAYEPNKRVMLKVKHERECDCVVAGFRWHKASAGEAVGSLLLGLYDAQGKLQHVGVAASFTAAKRVELVTFLAPYRREALRDHPWAASGDGVGLDQRQPGARSRWSQGKDLAWEPLRSELVVEVGFDHMQGTRFRHTAQLRRWRIDKPATECTYDQLEVVPPQELAAIFSAR